MSRSRSRFPFSPGAPQTELEAVHALLPMISEKKLADSLLPICQEVEGSLPYHWRKRAKRPWNAAISEVEVVGEARVRLIKKVKQGAVFPALSLVKTWLVNTSLLVAYEQHRKYRLLKPEAVESNDQPELPASRTAPLSEELATMREMISAIPDADLALVLAYDKTGDEALRNRAYRARRRIKALLNKRFGITSLKDVLTR